MNPIRIILADDSETFLDSLGTLLREEHWIEIVGQARSGIEAYHLISQSSPDLLLLDFFMIGMNGLETTELIKSHPRAPKVILLSLYTDRSFAEAAAKAGADAFVHKQDLPEALWKAIHQLFPDSPSKA